jgi:LysM repeat protein
MSHAGQILRPAGRHPVPARLSVGAGLLVLLAACQPGGGYGGSDEKDRNIQNGIAARSDGRYEAAEKAFLRALQNQPNSAVAHWSLGILYYQDLRDYTSALYHFERFARLQPNERVDQVRQVTEACRQELAKGVPIGNLSAQMQREISALVRTNTALRQELDQLRARLAQRDAADRAAAQPRTVPPDPADPGLRSDPTPPATYAAIPQPRSTPRTHRIQKGETLASVARTYGFELPAVIAANPGVIPQRIQPGQIINLPPR